MVAHPEHGLLVIEVKSGPVGRDREAVDAAAFVRAFPRPEGASGIAVGIGGRIRAIELFDAPATLAGQWPRLVEAAVSAYFDHRRAEASGMEARPLHRYPDEGAIGRTLARAAAATEQALVAPSVGEGFDIRLAAPKLRGGALVVGDRPVHLELFRLAA